MAALQSAHKSAFAGVTPSVGRTLLQSAAPTTCSAGAWNALDGDGRCVYTDCYVGDRDPADCFGCSGADCDNGCGPEPNTIFLAIQNLAILDSIGEIYDFSEGCCIHDYCYASTAFDQATCDKALYADAVDSCKNVNADDFPDFTLRFIKTGVTRARRFLCEQMAQLFYYAVDKAGATPYATGQEVTKAWEQSESCAAPCPSTQRSGGQGTTALRIDMKGRTGPFEVTYNMFTIPDGLDVTYGADGQGQSLFSTRGLVSGRRTASGDMPDGNSDIVTVVVNAPEDGTAWDVFIGCPANEPGEAK